MTAVLRDSELQVRGASGWLYAATYDVDGYTIRIRLRADPHYSSQSYAVAEVLAKDLTWTTVVDAAPPEGRRGTNAEMAQSADAIAQWLLERATVILTGGGGAP